MKTMHLFAGGGGGMYADLILGHTPTVAVEWEKAACDVLRDRKAEWWPDCEIIETDIRAFSGVQYAGKVDCIHAGFPCQDLSVAGKRAGLDGDRSSLYVEALRIFREVRPRYLFLENVTGITSANGGEALNRVMSDLAEIGLDARWTCLRASDVGANHRRDRWWCLAYDASQRESARGMGLSAQAKKHNGREEHNKGGSQRDDRGRCGENVADAKGQRCDKGGLSERTPTQVSDAKKYGPDVSDAEGDRFRQKFDFNSSKICDEDRTPNKYQGGDRDRNDRDGNRTWWSTEPPVGRVANGVAQRVNRLKMLGNGQVPLQAAYAWVMLGGPTEIIP